MEQYQHLVRSVVSTIDWNLVVTVRRKGSEYRNCYDMVAPFSFVYRDHHDLVW